jgi:hypothetical protein
MRLLDVGGNLGTGLAIGAGAALLTPVVLPVLGALVKPVVKAAIKGGMLLYEKGEVLSAEVKETFEDLAAEAKSELKQATPKAKGKTAKAAS